MNENYSLAAAGRGFDNYLGRRPGRILGRDSALSGTVSLGSQLPPGQEDDPEVAALMGELIDGAHQLINGALDAVDAGIESLNCTTKVEHSTTTSPDGVTTTTTRTSTTCSPEGLRSGATKAREWLRELMNVTNSLEQAGRDADERLARVRGSSSVRLQQPWVSVTFEIGGARGKPDEDDAEARVAVWVIEGFKILAGAIAGAVVSEAIDDDSPQQGCTTTTSGSYDEAAGTFSSSTETTCVSSPGGGGPV